MAKMKVTIVGDASSAKRAFRDVGYGAESMASKAGRAFGTLAKTAAFAAGAAGIGAIAITLKQGYNEWKESTEVAAQTDAVLKSTGHISNVTAKSLDKLAQSLLAKSGVDDEAIKSGENMLLTFTNIRNESGKNNDVFDQTTQALLDMTTVMTHGNVTSEAMSKQAIQLGKALNDPVHGLTALRRVGVTFSDAQKAMIEKMVAAGDTMGAQKVILRELNKEFGGSAEALGKTLPGQINIARETFNNLAGDLFTTLLPTLTKLLKTFSAWISNTRNQKVVMDTLKSVIGAITGAFNVFKSVVSAVDRVTGGFKNTVVLLMGLGFALKLASWAAALRGLVTTLGLASAAERVFGTSAVVAGAQAQAAGMKAAIAARLFGSLGFAAAAMVLPHDSSHLLNSDWVQKLKDRVGPISPKGPHGPMKSPKTGVTRSAPLGGSRRGDAAAVTVGPITVHGSADSDFAKKLAGELAVHLRGGRVPALQQAIASV